MKKIVSWCRAAVVEPSEPHGKVERTLKAYEREGKWSHAAELADSYSEKTGDPGLKARALDDYKKAGYDADTLCETFGDARHVAPHHTGTPRPWAPLARGLTGGSIRKG